MSVDILDGSEEFPGRWGPDRGVVEFVPTTAPWLDYSRPDVHSEELRHSFDVGRAAVFLANPQNLNQANFRY